MFDKFWKPKEAPLDYAPEESAISKLNRALERLGAAELARGGDDICIALAAMANAIADRLDALETRNGWTDA